MAAPNLPELLHELSILLERVHNEYKNFFSGAEKKPPALHREQLERKMDQFRAIHMKSGDPVLKFKAQNLIAKFSMYRDSWDRRLRQRESGEPGK